MRPLLEVQKRGPAPVEHGHFARARRRHFHAFTPCRLPRPPRVPIQFPRPLNDHLAATNVEISAVSPKAPPVKKGGATPLHQKPGGYPTARNAKKREKDLTQFSLKKGCHGARGTVRNPHTITSCACSRKGRIRMDRDCSLARPNPNPYWDLPTFGIAGQSVFVFSPLLPCRHPRGRFSSAPNL